MKSIIIFLLHILIFFQCFAQDTLQHIIPGRLNSSEQQQKPYVILISADGFRADFAEKYNAVNLLRLMSSGVAADYMQSSFPSYTFPNHYTIVTGLYPAHHGLADNNFYDEERKEVYQMEDKKDVLDSSWYHGTPLWVLAEQQHLLSASFYWVASEVEIQQARPTYYYVYSTKIDINTRIQTVKDWLQLPEDKRPHFITFYLPQVDNNAHKYGPDSKETGEAVKFVDDAIGKMVNTLDSLHLPINYIFVSDHGMTKIDESKMISLPASVDTSKFTVPAGSSILQLHAKNKNDIRPLYRVLKRQAIGYNVYLKNKTPLRWHYRGKDDLFNRLGDIILVADPPYFFNITSRPNTSIGKHGYDPALTDMHASFYAWGPAFKQQLKIQGFENVNVFPLIARILGLSYSFHIDGNIEVLEGILK